MAIKTVCTTFFGTGLTWSNTWKNREVEKTKVLLVCETSLSYLLWQRNVTEFSFQNLHKNAIKWIIGEFSRWTWIYCADADCPLNCIICVCMLTAECQRQQGIQVNCHVLIIAVADANIGCRWSVVRRLSAASLTLQCHSISSLLN